MKHPSAEEWMDWLYRELPPESAAALDRHLEQCDSCAQRVRSWKTTCGALDQWSWAPAKRPPRSWRRPLLRAAAALFLLGLGFGGGWLTSDARIHAALANLVPAAVASEVQSQWRPVEREWNQVQKQTELALDAQAAIGRTLEVFDQNQAAQWASIQERFARMETSHNAELAELRRSLETVAVYAENTIRQTRSDLLHLTGYSPAAVPLSSNPD